MVAMGKAKGAMGEVVTMAIGVVMAVAVGAMGVVAMGAAVVGRCGKHEYE